MQCQPVTKNQSDVKPPAVTAQTESRPLSPACTPASPSLPGSATDAEAPMLYVSPREAALAAIKTIDIIAANLYWSLYDLSARPNKQPDPIAVSGWVHQAGDMHRAAGELVGALVELLTDEICSPGGR